MIITGRFNCNELAIFHQQDPRCQGGVLIRIGGHRASVRHPIGGCKAECSSVHQCTLVFLSANRLRKDVRVMGACGFKSGTVGRVALREPALMQDPFIREKFTRERSAARKLVAEYFRRFPKNRYQTEVESWPSLR
jgi:hypothetical protein